jgi:photosystem II stability/assembly factor-like uncharacterized protein
MRIKIACILLFLCSASFASPVDFWLQQQTPTTKWLYKFSFIDSLNGWAVGDSGIIIHTTNGAVNWTIQNSGVLTFIYSVCFLNNRLGWAVTDRTINFSGSSILKTTNGGIVWAVTPFPDTTIQLYTVHFTDSLNGWTGGSQGNIFQTTNGGSNWVLRLRDSLGCAGFPVFKMSFYNGRPFYGCGGAIDFAGVVVRTTTQGNTWIGACVAPEPIFDILIFDSLDAIGTGGDFDFGVSVVKTTNGGINWQYRTLGVFGKGEAISFRTGSEGWIAAGFSAKLIYTFDSSTSWRDIYTPDSTAAFDLVFTDPYHGYAVGYNGLILKYNRDAIGVGNLNENIPSEFSLLQNYPNPFNASTKFKYQISKLSDVQIVVYDVLGREAATLVNEKLKPGTYEVQWDAANYPSGVYYYRMQSGDFSVSRRMVLLK